MRSIQPLGERLMECPSDKKFYFQAMAALLIHTRS